MIKSELIHAVNARGRKISVSDVDAIFEVISNSLKEGNDVTLRGFGTFSVCVAKEKVAQNIIKGTRVVIPSHKVVKFKPAKDLKESVINS